MTDTKKPATYREHTIKDDKGAILAVVTAQNPAQAERHYLTTRYKVRVAVASRSDMYLAATNGIAIEDVRKAGEATQAAARG